MKECEQMKSSHTSSLSCSLIIGLTCAEAFTLVDLEWLFGHAFLYSPLPSYFLFHPELLLFPLCLDLPLVDAILKVGVFNLKTSG